MFDLLIIQCALHMATGFVYCASGSTGTLFGPSNSMHNSASRVVSFSCMSHAACKVSKNDRVDGINQSIRLQFLEARLPLSGLPVQYRV